MAVPKWFRKYLQTNQESMGIIIMIALLTGVTSFGLPIPPKFIQDLIDDNPWFRWIMLWGLLYQGGSGQNLMITNIAFGILFTLYNLNWNEIKHYYFKYNKYLVIALSPFLFFLF